MDPTAIQAGTPPQFPTNGTAVHAGEPSARPTEAPRTMAKPQKSPVVQALEAIASLKVTVVLFVLSLILVFYGTLAQVDNGIWTVVNQYFRSAVVKIPLEVVLIYVNYFPKLFNPDVREPLFQIPGWIPYPGGWLLGGLLLTNLVAAHLVRFKLSWERAGILVLHAGIIVMMIGEVITGVYQVEGNMVIEEGSSSNFLIHAGSAELAVEKTVDPKTDQVVVVPAAKLQDGAKVDDERLPFVVEVVKYMKNSDLANDPPGKDNPADAGIGRQVQIVEKPEGSGVDQESRHDYPGAFVTLTDRKTGQRLGTYALSAWLDPQWVTAGGATYRVSLRHQRSQPKPYTFHLEKFDHKKHVGTDKARDYRSHIHLVDPSRGEDRKIEIYMNNPLRYHGETFFQASFQPASMGGRPSTVLQVVRNPGWTLPYISCAMVSLGMLIHFGQNLWRFVGRRAG